MLRNPARICAPEASSSASSTLREPPASKAITATAHKLARIVYALVRFGGEYVKQSQDEYESANRERLERSLRKRAKELGYEVVKKPAPEPDASDTPRAV